MTRKKREERMRKSPTCVGKTSKAPVIEYESEEAAQEAAHYAKKNYRRNLTVYHCDRCGKWHLAPANRQTPSAPCQSCIGNDGLPKASYETEEAAEKRARILRKEQRVLLRTYPCPFGNGWHLTKG